MWRLTFQRLQISPMWILHGFLRALNEKYPAFMELLLGNSQRKSSCFCGALSVSHLAFGELSKKSSWSCFRRASNEIHPALAAVLWQPKIPSIVKRQGFCRKNLQMHAFESFDGLFCGHREPANPSYPVSHPKPISTQLLDWFAILWNGNPFDLQSF